MHREEEAAFLKTLQSIVSQNKYQINRTGVDTKSIFSTNLRFNLFNRKLPLVSTRLLDPRMPIAEMLWFLKGDTDVKWLVDRNIHIWNQWVDPETAVKDENGKILSGSIGDGAYGAQWVNWEDTRIVSDQDYKEKYIKYGYEVIAGLPEGKSVITRKINQIENLIWLIKNDESSRRMIVTAWNPGKLMDMQLPPCHHTFTIYVKPMSGVEKSAMLNFIFRNGKCSKDSEYSFFDTDTEKEFIHDYTTKKDKKELVEKYKLPTSSLCLQLTQRSCDMAVGGAFNITQYGFLAHLLAKYTNTWAKELSWNVTNAHIYNNQEAEVITQIKRKPVQGHRPILRIRRNLEETKTIHELDIPDFWIDGVKQLERIKFIVTA